MRPSHITYRYSVLVVCHILRRNLKGMQSLQRSQHFLLLNIALFCFRLEHILFNLLTQLLLGIPLEMVHGGLRVGAIYLAGVVGG